MPEINYEESLTYWLREKTSILYTILLSSDTIKVLPTNKDRDISSYWNIYSRSVNKNQIKSILLSYTHLKWDISEVFGLI